MSDELILTETDFASVKATKSCQGNRLFQMAAGKKLDIKNTAESGKMFDRTVPAGKVWVVTINLNIEETDE